MVEVFTTNINSKTNANIITGLLHLYFPNLKANIDLFDQDNVLRIESSTDPIDNNSLISFVKNLGYKIDVMP
jgi:hypothetical protein